jgi:hypothetical protein
MTLPVVRFIVTVAIVILAMLTPIVIDANDRSVGDLNIIADPASSRRPHTTAFAQDGNDNDDNDDDDDDDDNDDDDDDGDNDDDDDDDDDDGDNDDDDDDDDDDGDNDDDDDDEGDNDDDDDDGDDEGDNDDDEGDNDDDDDDGDNAGVVEDPGPTFDTSVTQASGITTGGDSSIALPGDRVAIRSFPWVPQGISVTLRLVDHAGVPVPPSRPVGALIFQVEAQDAAGSPLTVLPAEVNLSARYTNREAASLNKSQVALLWLDPATNRWVPAPKLVTEPAFNYVASSTTNLGTYCVCVP